MRYLQHLPFAPAPPETAFGLMRRGRSLPTLDNFDKVMWGQCFEPANHDIPVAR
jgi:hypothetical protein